MDIAAADQLDTSINQCRDVVRLTRLVLVGCVVLAAVLAGLRTGSWALLPIVCSLPVAVNLVFHQWQLMKLRLARAQLES